MRDVSSRAFEYLHFLFINMDTMRQCDVASTQTNRIEICDVSHACIALDQFTFTSILGCMRMDHHAAIARQFCNLQKKLSCATDRKAWRKTITNASICFSVPSLKQRYRFPH